MSCSNFVHRSRDVLSIIALTVPSSFLGMNRHGEGFGLGLAVVVDPCRLGVAAAAGEASWGGMASTFFILDPADRVLIVLMTQLVPSSTYNFRRQIRTLVYSALQ